MDNHIITTRFNQILKFYNSPLNMYEGENSWMAHRIKLFENYTLKSWLNQSDQNYHLFLISDPNTPEKYKNILNSYEDLGINLKILYTDENVASSEFKSILKTEYLKSRTNDSSEVIISRCDNDDLISVNYNLAVKQATQENDIISLASGMTYDSNTESANLFFFPKSPFVSVKSNLEEFKSPWYVGHTKIPSTQISTDYPLWCWVIHEQNSHNTMMGSPIENFDSRSLKTLFGYE